MSTLKMDDFSKRRKRKYKTTKNTRVRVSPVLLGIFFLSLCFLWTKYDSIKKEFNKKKKIYVHIRAFSPEFLSFVSSRSEARRKEHTHTQQEIFKKSEPLFLNLFSSFDFLCQLCYRDRDRRLIFILPSGDLVKRVRMMVERMVSKG